MPRAIHVRSKDASVKNQTEPARAGKRGSLVGGMSRMMAWRRDQIALWHLIRRDSIIGFFYLFLVWGMRRIMYIGDLLIIFLNDILISH